MWIGGVTVFVALTDVRGEVLYKRFLHEVVVRSQDDHLGKGGIHVHVLVVGSGSGHTLHVGHAHLHTLQAWRALCGSGSLFAGNVKQLLYVGLFECKQRQQIGQSERAGLLVSGVSETYVATIHGESYCSLHHLGV